MNILVTGGAGYIGSHTVLELIAEGHTPIIADNFSNSKKSVLARLEKIAGTPIKVYEADLCDKSSLEIIFSDNNIDAAIHFASFKAVGESVNEPLKYYQNNLVSTINLCDLLIEYGVKKLIFSSSATVYGNATKMPLKEDAHIESVNPYGHTKVMNEQILKDVAHVASSLQITCLRYFNPVGAHPSGDIGEDPDDIPNNLMPYISQVAVGKLEKLSVFGGDYPTPDGTAIRDYIHVTDIARGHTAALKEDRSANDNWVAYNLGTGTGKSVLEVVTAYEKACGKEIPYSIVDRRPGDAVMCFADPHEAEVNLGWKAELTLDQACVDAWNWQSKNPNGYN